MAFASAVITGDFKDIEHEFHVGEVVTALSVSLMVVGFGLGPLAWSPMVSFLIFVFLLQGGLLTLRLLRVNCMVVDRSG